MNHLKRDLTLFFAGAALTAAGYGIARVQADGAPTAQPLWYSGTVSDAQGKPLTGNHKASVRLFDTVDKAAQSLCVVGPKDVSFDSGRFRVDVSQCESKQQTASVFAAKADLYVELTIDDDSKPFDRAKIGAVPFALEAQHAANGVTTGAIVMFAGGCPAGWTEYMALRGRVPRGEATGNPASLDSGGTDDLIVPSHTHSVQTKISGGDHAHVYTDPGHQHAPPGGWNFLTGGGGDPGCSAMLPVGSGFDCGHLTQSSQINISIQSASHIHDLSTTTGATGSSGIGANMQAYREVVFCIRM